MKSCLVPPNLKKAGLKAFAKVFIFGELDAYDKVKKTNKHTEMHRCD